MESVPLTAMSYNSWLLVEDEKASAAERPRMQAVDAGAVPGR